MEAKLGTRPPIRSNPGAEAPPAPELCGLRLADLSAGLISFASQALSGRFCDARWWAADPAIAAAVARPEAATRAAASERLAALLKAYPAYLDLWIADADGLVVSQGRHGGYCYLRKTSVAGEGWFRDALEARERCCFQGVSRPAAFGQAVATYASPIRRGSVHDGPVVGVLGLFFDWRKQAQALVDGVRVPPAQRPYTRTMIVDARHRVLASTGELGVLSETFPLHPGSALSGYYGDGHGHLVGFARSMGGENFFDRGWYGVVEQDIRVAREPLTVSPRGYGTGRMIPVQSRS